jgi:ribosomal-protein-alanine N-acetyltransferase
MAYLFTSRRLGFRRYQPSDFARLCELNADPAVMEFFPSTLDEAGTRELVERITQQYTPEGFGWYAVDRLDTDTFIGLIGFLRPRYEAPFSPPVEIGWRLHQDAWGQGFATEGAKACLAFGQDTLGMNKVFSYTPVPNRRSERVMQKLGMEKVGTFEHPLIDEGHWLRMHVLYCWES